MRGKHWKRFLIVLLAAVMGLGLLCGCKTKEVKGSFYTLQEAFTIGYLTHEDIETIAYYQNGWITDRIRYPYELDKETETVVRRAWAERGGISENDITFTAYYGTYHGCVAIKLWSNAGESPDVAMWGIEVDGIEITYNGPNQIYIWKADENDEIQGSFYTLTEAYNNSFLTHECLADIAYFQNSWMTNKIEYTIKLHEKIETTVKRSWAKQHNIRIDEVIMDSYFGTYSGCVAVMFSQVTEAVEWTETIDGVDIHYRDGNRIYVWKIN